MIFYKRKFVYIYQINLDSKPFLQKGYLNFASVKLKFSGDSNTRIKRLTVGNRLINTSSLKPSQSGTINLQHRFCFHFSAAKLYNPTTFKYMSSLMSES